MARRIALWIVVFSLVALIVPGLVSPALASGELNYSVTFEHDGVDKPLLIRAWLPDSGALRGILYLPPSWGGDTRNSVSSQQYKAFATALGIGIIGIQDRDGWPGQYEGANATEIRSNVQMVLDGAAAGLGCPEISNAPLAFYGFSKGGWMDGEIASYMPERTICVVADKSHTWIYSLSDQAKYAPAMFIGGSKDTTAGSGAGYGAFSVWRGAGGQASLVEDWNVGHSYTNFGLVESFISQSMALRYPAGQLPSTTPGHPLLLNQIDPVAGWLVESSYSSGFNWIRNPDALPVASYTKDAGTACWVPDQTVAMILRAQNAADPTTGIKPVDIVSNTTPLASAYAYEEGQTINLSVTNSWLNLPDVTRVQVFHENQPIGDFTSLPSGGVSVQCTLSQRGVDTFWTQVTYLYNGQPTYATDYFTAVVVPEPCTIAVLVSGWLMTLSRRKRRW